MPRHHSSQVHRQLSHQLEVGYLKRAPPAYAAVVNHLPPSLPARRTVDRPDEDLPQRLTATYDTERRPVSVRRRSPRPLPIAYTSLDVLRKAFYRDHPFEAYRPVSLVESGSDLLRRVTGGRVRPLHADGSLGHWGAGTVGLEAWQELRQKTCSPSVDEQVISLFRLDQTRLTARVVPAAWPLHSPFTKTILHTILSTLHTRLRFPSSERCVLKSIRRPPSPDRKPTPTVPHGHVARAGVRPSCRTGG